MFIFCNELIQDLESSASGRTPFYPTFFPAPSFHPKARRLISLRTNGLSGYIINFV